MSYADDWRRYRMNELRRREEGPPYFPPLKPGIRIRVNSTLEVEKPEARGKNGGGETLRPQSDW